MLRNSGLRGGSANAHPDHKMSGDKREFEVRSSSMLRQLKRSASKKRRQHEKKECQL